MKRWIVLACIAVTLVAGVAWGKDSDAAKMLIFKYRFVHEKGKPDTIFVTLPDTMKVVKNGVVHFIGSGNAPPGTGIAVNVLRLYPGPQGPSYDINSSSGFLIGHNGDTNVVECTPEVGVKDSIIVRLTLRPRNPKHPFTVVYVKKTRVSRDGPQVVIDANGGAGQ